jgi:hypothetical protein
LTNRSWIFFLIFLFKDENSKESKKLKVDNSIQFKSIVKATQSSAVEKRIKEFKDTMESANFVNEKSSNYNFNESKVKEEQANDDGNFDC